MKSIKVVTFASSGVIVDDDGLEKILSVFEQDIPGLAKEYFVRLSKENCQGLKDNAVLVEIATDSREEFETVVRLLKAIPFTVGPRPRLVFQHLHMVSSSFAIGKRSVD